MKLLSNLKSLVIKSLNNKRLIGIAVILVITIFGVRFIIGGHAATPSSSISASSGTLSGQTSIQKDSSGNYVNFGPSFNYGFDFSDAGPDYNTMPYQDSAAKLNYNPAVDSAKLVLAKFSGSFMDVSINGFGSQTDPQDSQCNPRTTPPYNVCSPVAVADSTNTDISSIKSRIKIVTDANGEPVITLVQAPAWMYLPANCPNGLAGNINGNLDENFNTTTTPFTLPPCPDNYPAFASLSAYIAKSFPQVKHFVVWSEVRDFYNPAAKVYDAASYTALYNDVYTAIKKVRPDAQVGGPYAALSADPCPITPACNTISTLSGTYGYVNQIMLDVLKYWLQNKTGADFLAVDGGTEIAKANNSKGDGTITDPLTSSEKYAFVDKWIESQTGYNNLPIWWMESHIAPSFGLDSNGTTIPCLPDSMPSGTTCWSDAQGAAARIATLILMNSSGATVGMQWQAQSQADWPDEGLWTSTQLSNGTGGQATVLANDLGIALPVLNQRLTRINGQPTGVIAASESSKLILVNTLNTTQTATVNNTSISLNPDEVKVIALP